MIVPTGTPRSGSACFKVRGVTALFDTVPAVTSAVVAREINPDVDADAVVT